MRRLLAALLLMAPTWVGAACTIQHGYINLEIPVMSDPGSVWGPCLVRDFISISTNVFSFTASGATFTSSVTFKSTWGVISNQAPTSFVVRVSSQNGAEMFNVEGNGNVGIGTNTVTNQMLGATGLGIYGTNAGLSLANTSNKWVFYTSGAALHLTDAVSAVERIVFGAPDGSVSIIGSTMTVANNGSVTAPSQPGGTFYRSAAQSEASGTDIKIFFDTTYWSQGGLGYLTTSSGTITIPTGLAGVYSITCGGAWAAGGTSYDQLYIQRNSTIVSLARIGENVTYSEYAQAHVEVLLNAGDTIECYTEQNSGVAKNFQAAPGNIFGAFLSMQKLW